MNQIVLTGRIARIEEIKDTTNSRVVNFSLAVDQFNGKEKVTLFVPCVAWGKLAARLGDWYKVGNLVGVIGRLDIHNYITEDEKKHTFTQVVVNTIEQYTPKDKGKEEVEEEEDEEVIDTLPFNPYLVDNPNISLFNLGNNDYQF